MANWILIAAGLLTVVVAFWLGRKSATLNAPIEATLKPNLSVKPNWRDVGPRKMDLLNDLDRVLFLRLLRAFFESTASNYEFVIVALDKTGRGVTVHIKEEDGRDSEGAHLRECLRRVFGDDEPTMWLRSTIRKVEP